jgi:hypothetical protein
LVKLDKLWFRVLRFQALERSQFRERTKTASEIEALLTGWALLGNGTSLGEDLSESVSAAHPIGERHARNAGKSSEEPLVLVDRSTRLSARAVYVSHIHNVTPPESLTVPVTFLFTNVFESALHKYVMHSPVNIKGLRAVYERHVSFAFMQSSLWS